MRPTRLHRFFLLAALFAALASVRADEHKNSAQQTIAALVDDESELRGVPFPEVVRAATGKTIIPFVATNAIDRELLSKIGGALDRVLQDMNAPDAPAQKEERINEVSAHFERAIKDGLNRIAGFDCDWPKTAAGKVQHSGYPDLRLVDKTSGYIVYIDPKLYEQGSRGSSLRTFYFEPKKETNKILDDARHLVVGFEHGERKGGHWKFLRWELVDLSKFRVRLKAEFQGSNRDLYQSDAILKSSRE